MSNQTPPNFLFIMADDLGFGDVSFRGLTPDVRTPAIDRIAHEGVRLDHFYSNGPVCSPARTSLLTGRRCELVDVPGVVRPAHPDHDYGHLNHDAVSLVELLRDKGGYRTSLLGKWHLGIEPPNYPLDRGFDHFRGNIYGMVDCYYRHNRGENNFMRSGRETLDVSGTHTSELYTDWALQELERCRDSNDPFFMYLSYNAPQVVSTMRVRC